MSQQIGLGKITIPTDRNRQVYHPSRLDWRSLPSEQTGWDSLPSQQTGPDQFVIPSDTQRAGVRQYLVAGPPPQCNQYTRKGSGNVFGMLGWNFGCNNRDSYLVSLSTFSNSLASGEWILVNNELESVWKETIVSECKALSRHLPVGTEWDHVTRGSPCPGRVSNQVECKPETLLLYRFAQFLTFVILTPLNSLGYSLLVRCPWKKIVPLPANMMQQILWVSACSVTIRVCCG
jgi:hypothetical protein